MAIVVAVVGGVVVYGSSEIGGEGGGEQLGALLAGEKGRDDSAGPGVGRQDGVGHSLHMAKLIMAIGLVSYI